MKSGTSFFNAAVLRKDITRFTPLWGLYLIGVWLICFSGFFQLPSTQELVQSMNLSVTAFAFVKCVYALLSAALLFGDLLIPGYAMRSMPCLCAGRAGS